MAVFTQPLAFVPVTVSAGNNGSISNAGATAICNGNNLTCTITPNSGYHIDSVFVDGAFTGIAATYTFSNVTTAHTIRATFAANCVATSATFTISACNSYTWVAKGNKVYTANNTTDTIKLINAGGCDSVVTLNLTIKPNYTITASAGSNGSISNASATVVCSGNNLTYTITPNSGFSIDSVLVDSAFVGRAVTYTFSNVVAAHTIRAVFACIVAIPDANFKAYLVANAGINTNGDAEIQCTEAAAFAGAIDISNLIISDLTGIETFVNLTSLNCRDIGLTILNLNSNAAITYLNCSGNRLTDLNISSNTALTYLDCNNSSLTSLNTSSNTALTYLKCNSNPLTSLNLSSNTALTQLFCINNGLTSLNVSSNTALTLLNCSFNALTAIDVSSNTALTEFNCNNSSVLNFVNLRNGNNAALLLVNVSNTPNLTCIQVDNIANATGYRDWIKPAAAKYSLNCACTPLSSTFTVSACNTYTWVAKGNKVYTANNTTDTIVVVNANRCDSIVTLNLTILPNYTITASAGNNGSISNASATAVCSGNNQTYTITPNSGFGIDSVIVDGAFVGKAATYTFSNVIANHTIRASFVCIVTILDANFKAALIANTLINTNGDAEIQCSEAIAFTGLLNLNRKNITDLTGIAAFVNMDSLDCSINNLSSLNLSSNTKLTYLNCGNNQLASLNISDLTALKYLVCSKNNNLTTLNLSSNTALTYLDCNDNKLTSLNLSSNTALTYLNCNVNLNLASLNITNNTALTYLDCSLNFSLTSLNVSSNTALTYLNCSSNRRAIV